MNVPRSRSLLSPVFGFSISGLTRLLAVIVGLFTLGCREEAPPPPPPKTKLSFVLVFPPEVKEIAEFATAEATEHFTREPLPDNSEVIIELQEHEAIEASRQIARGTLKPTAWISSSTTLTEMTNTTVVNLGAPQRDCAPLFASGVVAVVDQSAWNRLSNSHGPTISLSSLLSSTPAAALSEPGSGKDTPVATARRSSTLGLVYPGESLGSLASLLTLLNASLAKAPPALPIDLGAAQFQHRARTIQDGASFFAATPGHLIAWAASAPPSLARVGLLTEDQLIRNQNQKVRGVPIREGTALLDYQLCLSDSDWVGAPHLAVAEQLKTILLGDRARELAHSRGFRVPKNPSPDSRNSASKDFGLAVPVLPVFPTFSGENLIQLIASYPTWRGPVSLVIVVDISGGMAGDRLTAVQAALQRTFTNLPERLVCNLVTFDSEVTIRLRESRACRGLGPALQPLTAGGGSALYDAIKVTVDQQISPTRTETRREILIVTEGHDVASTISGNALTDYLSARLGQTPINFTVLTLSAPDSIAAPLKTVTDLSGGEIITVSLATLDQELTRYVETL